MAPFVRGTTLRRPTAERGLGLPVADLLWADQQRCALLREGAEAESCRATSGCVLGQRDVVELEGLEGALGVGEPAGTNRADVD